MLVKDEKMNIVLKYIAENPGSSLYNIGENSGVGRITVVRKIKNEYKLVENGYLRFEKGERNAENYWVTLKGLFFAVASGNIEAKNARDIRLKNKLQFPNSPLPINLKPLVEDMEKDFPKQFYTVNDVPCRINFSVGFLDFLPYIITFMIFGELVKRNDPYVKKYIKGKDLVFRDGTIIEDYKDVFRVFMMVYSAFSGK
jgi:hypothetical protein